MCAAELPATPEVAALLARGVLIPAPHLVHVDPQVRSERIAPGAYLGPGTVLEGADTLLLEGAKVSTEGPAAVRNCGLGEGVVLASGSYRDAVFLDGASHGPSGHVRGGTLFEEGASAAHATGTKQTVLLPFATLGSDVNFCDALLAGGRDAKNHSEVGSGFIHFNFTPHGPSGDKATASLFGDVSEGVWLRASRIFLGGAGGVVGPVHVAYGTVLAAGGVYRRDRAGGTLVLGEKLPPREMPFDPTILRRVAERVQKSLRYLAELQALRSFHRVVRRPLAASGSLRAELGILAEAALRSGVHERLKQVGRLLEGLPGSIRALRVAGNAADELAFQERLLALWPACAARLAEEELDDAPLAQALGDSLPCGPVEGGYLAWVRALPDEVVQAGQAALAQAVDGLVRRVMGQLAG